MALPVLQIKSVTSWDQNENTPDDLELWAGAAGAPSTRYWGEADMSQGETMDTYPVGSVEYPASPITLQLGETRISLREKDLGGWPDRDDHIGTVVVHVSRDQSEDGYRVYAESPGHSRDGASNPGDNMTLWFEGNGAEYSMDADWLLG